MPIHPDMKTRYPKNWNAISKRIRFERANSRCEWCEAENGEPHPETGSIVVLTVAHLDHDPGNNDEDNLAALCQKCHNTYDAPKRHINRKYRRLRDAGQLHFEQVPPPIP